MTSEQQRISAKKRQICQLSAFPGTFEGRAILKHIFEIKFLVCPEIFSLLGAIRDEKMTKNGEKTRRFSAKKDGFANYLPSLALSGVGPY